MKVIKRKKGKIEKMLGVSLLALVKSSRFGAS